MKSKLVIKTNGKNLSHFVNLSIQILYLHTVHIGVYVRIYISTSISTYKYKQRISRDKLSKERQNASWK